MSRALANALRTGSASVAVELGDLTTDRTVLVERAVALGLRESDGSAVAFDGSSADDLIWEWALDCMSVASWWHLYSDAQSVGLLMYATDQLGAVVTFAAVQDEDLNGQLERVDS